MYDESRTPLQVSTRLPAELGEQLMNIAQEERRSLSNLLLIAVEEFIAKREAEQ